MRKLKRILTGLLLSGLIPLGQLLAHTPMCSCFDNEDGTITCEGGFSDGSSAEGVEIRVENTAGRILVKGTMDEISEFTFKTPSVPFIVIFDAGEGHTKTIEGDSLL